MSRLVDRGALVAAAVGAGVAATIVVSFLLVIPIEPVVWLLALPAGLLIGYYANIRSNRQGGAWSRILANALVAGAVTAATTAGLLLGVKAIFFFADGGYPNYNRIDAETGEAIPPSCQPGADCVYRRYLEAQPGDLAAAGVTDATTFSGYYWDQQLTTTGLVIGLTLAGGLGGGLAFRLVNRPGGGQAAGALAASR